MSPVESIAGIVSLAALCGFLNARYLRLPASIGLMAVALAGSAVLIGLETAGVIDVTTLRELVGSVDFADVLLHGLLGMLLFAGALHVDLTDLANHRWPIAGLALGGTLLSTGIVGVATWALLAALGHDIGIINGLMFGALISPTDPIAVLGILKSAKAPRVLAVQITGESLFNDGIGVVLFLIISAASTGAALSAGDVAILFLREVLGGAFFGVVVGAVAVQMMRRIDDYSVEVMITIAVVLAGYATAERLHISAPIAAVVAGLVVGNQGRRTAMSDTTREHIDMFWKLIDEILNAVLFLLLALEATKIRSWSSTAVASVSMIGIVLAARFISVAIPVTILRRRLAFPAHSIKILTWGGLRGGISVAMALSLPQGETRDILLALTYSVVAFTILVQGLTLKRVIRRLGPSTTADLTAPGETPQATRSLSVTAVSTTAVSTSATTGSAPDR